jgi:hypothetical protein
MLSAYLLLEMRLATDSQGGWGDNIETEIGSAPGALLFPQTLSTNRVMEEILFQISLVIFTSQSSLDI